MTRELSTTHGALLQAVLTGDRDANDAEVMAARRASPEFEARLAKLTQLGRRLDSVGAQERTDRDHDLAADSGDRPGVSIDHLVRAHQPRRSNRQRWVWPLAAAILLLSALTTLIVVNQSNDRDFTLGPPGSMQPEGAIDADAVFQWNHELPRGCSFEISFYNGSVENPLGTAPLYREDVGSETQWSIDTESEALLRGELVWRIRIRGADQIYRSGGGSRRVRL